MPYILIALLLQISITLFGQSIDRGNDNHYQKFQDDFQTSRIEEARLPAFERRAAQKVKDMFNYIEIISNKTYDETLRQEALKMCLDLFEKGSTVKSGILTGEKAKSYELASFFKAVFNTELAPIELSVSTIKTLKPLAYNEAKSAYTGSLELHLDIVWKGKAQHFQKDYIMEFQLKKVSKRFGTTTEQVWEVLLSNWYPRP